MTREFIVEVVQILWNPTKCNMKLLINQRSTSSIFLLQIQHHMFLGYLNLEVSVIKVCMNIVIFQNAVKLHILKGGGIV